MATWAVVTEPSVALPEVALPAAALSVAVEAQLMVAQLLAALPAAEPSVVTASDPSQEVVELPLVALLPQVA